MVRPYGHDELTHVHTELKLLQIDLVSFDLFKRNFLIYLKLRFI